MIKSNSMFGKGLSTIRKKGIVRVYSIVLFIIMTVSSVTYAEESGDMLNNFYIRHGDRSNPRIAITIDDGWYLTRMISLLEKYQMQCVKDVV